jgi:hypothetical protein
VSIPVDGIEGCGQLGNVGQNPECELLRRSRKRDTN